MKISKNQKGVGILIIIVIIMVIVGLGTFTAMSKFYETETYYVLKDDVPSRTQIAPDMLAPVITSKGTAPKTALNLGDVQSGQVFTQYPLHAGDILTSSNVGGFEDISVGVPDEWVITSFSVPADNAVGGRIQRGTYFDMMVVTPKGSFYPFVNILALDTTISLSGASSANAVNTDEAHSGQTSQYTVGMTPENAAKLQDLMTNNKGVVKLLLSPRSNEYQPPVLADYTGLFKWGNGVAGKAGEEPVNAGKDTDYTFSHVKRDEFGRPIAKVDSCSKGNAKVSGKACDKFKGDKGGVSPSKSNALDNAKSDTSNSSVDNANTDVDKESKSE